MFATQEATSTMEPLFLSTGSAFWTVKNVPRVLVPNVLSKCSGVA